MLNRPAILQTNRSSSVDDRPTEPIVCYVRLTSRDPPPCGARLHHPPTDKSENIPVIKAFGYAAQDATTPLSPFSFERRDPGERDVQIEILYCGVCHSDLHTVRGEWGGTLYPCVPGHEIVGRISVVGDEVTRFAVGDAVGVGCLVGSCRHCDACDEGLEQYCQNGF